MLLMISNKLENLNPDCVCTSLLSITYIIYAVEDVKCIICIIYFFIRIMDISVELIMSLITISAAYICIAQVFFFYFSLVTESERKKVREQFLYAEQELAAAKGREQALQDQLMKEVNDSHERLKKQFDQYGELEVCMLVLQSSYI